MLVAAGDIERTKARPPEGWPGGSIPPCLCRWFGMPPRPSSGKPRGAVHCTGKVRRACPLVAPGLGCPQRSPNRPRQFVHAPENRVGAGRSGYPHRPLMGDLKSKSRDPSA